MKKKLVLSFFSIVLVIVSVVAALNYYSNDINVLINSIMNHQSDDTVDDPIEEPEDPVDTGPKLSCYDYIDKMLVADGFTYLMDAKWGRGINNFFIVDIIAQEFQMADDLNLGQLTTEWYKTEFDRYLAWTYSYADKKIWNSRFLKTGGSKDSPSATMYAPFSDVTMLYYELPFWMQYYIEQTDKYGCSLTGLTKEKLLGEYKTKMSTATVSNVVSVFDRKSTDGVLRYYADARIAGKVEDKPRYKELNTVAEYMALDNVENWETFYMINVLYKDPTKLTYFVDLSGLQSSVIKEFVKDVVFTQTTSIVDEPRKETMGVYFIYIDNPNGQFKSMYEAVKSDQPAMDASISNFSKIKTSFESFVMLVNKNQVKQGQVYPTGPADLYGTLKVYLGYIHDVNPGIKVADDFLTYYTRPFNPKWQAMMGLTEFFDTKYGFTNDNIKYTWGK